jgi:hypothetical protein
MNLECKSSFLERVCNFVDCYQRLQVFALPSVWPHPPHPTNASIQQRGGGDAVLLLGIVWQRAVPAGDCCSASRSLLQGSLYACECISSAGLLLSSAAEVGTSAHFC